MATAGIFTRAGSGGVHAFHHYFVLHSVSVLIHGGEQPERDPPQPCVPGHSCHWNDDADGGRVLRPVGGRDGFLNWGDYGPATHVGWLACATGDRGRAGGGCAWWIFQRLCD